MTHRYVVKQNQARRRADRRYIERQHKAEWKAAVRLNTAKLTAAEARALIADYTAEMKVAGGPTIYSATIRGLTGGYNSQSINFYVLRRLAELLDKPSL